MQQNVADIKKALIEVASTLYNAVSEGATSATRSGGSENRPPSTSSSAGGPREPLSSASSQNSSYSTGKRSSERAGDKYQRNLPPNVEEMIRQKRQELANRLNK